MELDSPSSTPSQSPTLPSTAITLPELDNSSGAHYQPSPAALPKDIFKLPDSIYNKYRLPRFSNPRNISKVPPIRNTVSRPKPAGPASLRPLAITKASSVDSDTTSSGISGSTIQYVLVNDNVSPSVHIIDTCESKSCGTKFICICGIHDRVCRTFNFQGRPRITSTASGYFPNASGISWQSIHFSLCSVLSLTTTHSLPYHRSRLKDGVRGPHQRLPWKSPLYLLQSRISPLLRWQVSTDS